MRQKICPQRWGQSLRTPSLVQYSIYCICCLYVECSIFVSFWQFCMPFHSVMCEFVTPRHMVFVNSQFTNSRRANVKFTDIKCAVHATSKDGVLGRVFIVSCYLKILIHRQNYTVLNSTEFHARLRCQKFQDQIPLWAGPIYCDSHCDMQPWAWAAVSRPT